MVDGDFIGVTASGSAALGNGASGVAIYAGASKNTIGGTVSGSRDVISGNNGDGVYISDGATTGTVVEGDYIGTDSTGSKALPNFIGVVIQNGASDNTIGGTTASARDVISGNDRGWRPHRRRRDQPATWSTGTSSARRQRLGGPRQSGQRRGHRRRRQQ